MVLQRLLAGAVTISEQKDHLYLALQCLQHEHLAFLLLACTVSLGSQEPATSGGSTLLCRGDGGIVDYLCPLAQIEDLTLRILNSL